MIAKKLLIKSFGAVAVVGGVAGGVAYKINENVQVQKQEDKQKELNENNIELHLLIEKLQELKDQLEIVQQNIATTEKEIKTLEEKNIESKTKNRDLNKEINKLNISINSINQTIHKKTIFKDQKEIEEADYQKSVNTWSSKISQNNLRNQLNGDSLKEIKKEFNDKNNGLNAPTKEKNDAEKEKQTALLKKSSNSNAVSRLQTLLTQYKREEATALALYNEKKLKTCVSSVPPIKNAKASACRNENGETISEKDITTVNKLKQLTFALTQKQNNVLRTTGLLVEQQSAALISEQALVEKTNLFNEKVKSLNEKIKVVNELKSKKGNLEAQVREISSKILEDSKALSSAEKSLQDSKELSLKAKKDLTDALLEKSTEEGKREKVKSDLSINAKTLEEEEKAISTYKKALNNLNIQKWELEVAITAKEKLKTSLDKKVE